MNEDSSTIDSIESLYQALESDGELNNQAIIFLRLRSWLTSVSDFDPVTGDVLPVGIDNILDVIAKNIENYSDRNEIKDRIYRIVIHVIEALQAIKENMRDKIIREHALMPIYAAREIDSISVQWLSRKPGRTLREKLSGKPYIKAVRRRSSLDTLENRLLKAFILRLERILFTRQTALDSDTEDTCEELLVLLERWLRSQEFDEIGSWGNLPPNNTLLQDKRYRKIWDGWIWSQSIDENIFSDYLRMKHDHLAVIYWNFLSILNQTTYFRMIQQPLIIDYDKFIIKPKFPVKGFLFPMTDSFLTGIVKSINYEKKIGVIATDEQDYFFHKNDLGKGIILNLLKIQDEVIFKIGKNPKGECATNISFLSKPKEISISSSDEKFFVDFSKRKITVKTEENCISIIQHPSGNNKTYDLSPSSCIDVAKFILLSIFNSPPQVNHHTKNINQNTQFKAEESFIDLCSLRPKFMIESGLKSIFPFRLLLQYWPDDSYGELTIDCEKANAIYFHDDIKTISMRSLFLSESNMKDALKSSASMSFMKRIKEFVVTNSLTYLVPDWVNDFDLESIRKSVNFYYDNSIPLPKSIASIFSWQSSKKFKQASLNNNDIILVIDLFEGGISITPVQGIFNKELIDVLPESRGFYWERHPTLLISDKSTYIKMTNNLTQDGCQNSDELLALFGIDGLIRDAGELSFVSDDQWYHLPKNVPEILNNLDHNIVSLHHLEECLSKLNKKTKNASIFVLPLNNAINKIKLPSQYYWISSSSLPLKGCKILTKWQKTAGQLPLWRDHLPELSIRIFNKEGGYHENFFLVKDSAVTPQRGRKFSIQVDKTFILPNGQSHYSFPLLQGEGNNELQFVAYLKSSAFPLKTNTVCKLSMSYTYGADDPYELKFIPIDPEKAGFKSVRVEWRSISENPIFDLSNLSVPSFPSRKNWSDFQRYPKENGTEFSDLPDWCSSKLKNLNNLISTNSKQLFNELVNKRKVGTFDWGTTDKTGKYYCRVKVDRESIFCHSSRFIEQIDESSLREGQTVFLNISTNEKGTYGAYISFTERLPEKLQNEADIKVLNMQKSAQKGIFSLRFPVLTIWNNGHSLSDSDTPEDFRKSVLEGTKAALIIIKSEKYFDSLRDDLFFFLSCLHKDAPIEVANKLIEASKNKELLRIFNKQIAFSIGAAELSWQQDLLQNIINPIDNEGLTRSITFEILAIAFWREQELIFSLNRNQIEILTNNLLGTLEFDYQKVADGVRGYQVAILCKHLELLLALLRTRGFDDDNIKKILLPNMNISKQYTSIIDKISKLLVKNNIELRSRIKLQIEKPEYDNTPDLLYALRMFLTGDSGANTIQITGITDDD